MAGQEHAHDPCRCGHTREHHADHVNPLQVVPLALTEANEEDARRLPVTVYGAGPCTVAGCGCTRFTDA
jgi:hypothetical protein